MPAEFSSAEQIEKTGTHSVLVTEWAGISQAQVSRLEKNAITQIKKNL